MMLPQSKTFDPVIGMHIHLLVYPSVPPVIAPGVVMSIGLVEPDIMALVIGFVGDLLGLSPPDQDVLVHGCTATATGSDVMMVHAMPMGGPMSPTEAMTGDSKLYFGSSDVLIGDGAKYAVRLGEFGMGCCTVGRVPADMLIALQFDVFSGKASSFDSGTFTDDVVDFVVGELLAMTGAGDVWEAVGEAIWNSHEEILAFVADPNDANGEALLEKLGEEALSAAADLALDAVLEAILGPMRRRRMRALARRRPARLRPDGRWRGPRS